MSNGFPRRGSIFPGLLLIVIGVVFLLGRFDPAFGLGRLIWIYWPVVIILWGVAKLVDHFVARSHGQPRAPLLSGGEAALMILLAFVLTGFVFRDWIRSRYPDFNVELPPFHQSYSQSRELPVQVLPAGARVVADTELGDISVRAGEGNQLRVSVNESAWAPTESEANERMRRVDVAIEQSGNTYRVHPGRQSGSFGARVGVDLDIAIPKSASVEANTAHGDIHVTGVAGNVVAHTARGDIEIRDTGGDVAADLQQGDAKIANIAGNVRLTGRGSDVELSNISGDAAVQGPFFGTIHASRVAKVARYTSPWSDVTVTRLTGRLEVDPGNFLVSDSHGPMKVVTRNKNIDIQNVSGRIEIFNTHGAVKVRFSAPPRDDLSVTNDSSDIEVTLPASSGFGVSAVSRSGEVDSEFKGPSIEISRENEGGRISGKIGAAGPMLNITTTYGTIRLRKAG